MSFNYRIMSHEREKRPPASSPPAVVNFIVSDIPMVIVFNNLSIFFNRQHEVTSLLSFGEWTFFIARVFPSRMMKNILLSNDITINTTFL